MCKSSLCLVTNKLITINFDTFTVHQAWKPYNTHFYFHLVMVCLSSYYIFESFWHTPNNWYMTISNTFLISICKISLIDENHYIIDSSMTKEVCKRIRTKFLVCIEKEKFDSIQTSANRIKRFYNIWMHIRQTKFKKTQNVNLKLPKRIFICITGHCIVMFLRKSYYSDFSLVVLFSIS